MLVCLSAESSVKTCEVQSRSRCCAVMGEAGEFSVPCYWLVQCDFWSVKDPSVTRFPPLSNQSFGCIISVELQGSEPTHTGCVAQSWSMLALPRRARCGACYTGWHPWALRASQCCFGGMLLCEGGWFGDGFLSMAVEGTV